MIVTITPMLLFSQFPPQKFLQITWDLNKVTKYFKAADHSIQCSDNEIRHYIYTVDLEHEVTGSTIKSRFGDGFFAFIASHLCGSYQNATFARHVSPSGPLLDPDYFQ